MMRFEMLHPADQLVMMLDRIYHYGMTTTSGGNLSVLDDNGDIWITPSGIDKGSLTRRDIMQVKPDGTVIGPHTPSVELPFHRHIYKLRPDIMVPDIGKLVTISPAEVRQIEIDL